MRVVFLNGTNVSSMMKRVRKRMAGRVNSRSALGWRGAKEEPADFGNPSFINVKPSSAECRLTDITEPLTTDCLYADLLLWHDWSECKTFQVASKPPVY